MTKETERFIEIVCERFFFNQHIHSIEDYYQLLNMQGNYKQDIIDEFKEVVKILYNENPDTNYRIDQYGNAIENDGSITSFEKLCVLINMHQDERYKNKKSN